MELTLFFALAVLVLAGVAGGALLAQPAGRHPADLATGEHQHRHEASTPHKPERWTKTQ